MDNERTLNSIFTGVAPLIMAKKIAKITLCGSLQFMVTDLDDWTPPTEEQRKNLKDMLCIDVEIFD